MYAAAVWLAILGLAVPRGVWAGPAVILETVLGRIVVEVEWEDAPATSAWFVGYVERGQYDGASLYRAAALDDSAVAQIVQGGILADAVRLNGEVDVSRYGADYLDVLETTDLTGLRHLRGTVSLARDLLHTGQVIPEIVFCLRDTPSMDVGGHSVADRQGFPAFGRVVEGMDVLEAVARRERAGATTIPFLTGQILTEPVRVERAYLQPSLNGRAASSPDSPPPGS